MLDSQEEIFADLESTLRQLIENEETLIAEEKAPQLDPIEQALLRSTQESLAARFMHTREFFLEKSKKKERYRKLEEQLSLLQELNISLLNANRFSQDRRNLPRIGRNRKGSKTGKIAYCNL